MRKKLILFTNYGVSMIIINKLKSSQDMVDILLILEGTYPYVSGGVSSWVNQIITAFSNIKFGIIFLGGKKDDYDDFKYKVPNNVLYLDVHYLSEAEKIIKVQSNNKEKSKAKIDKLSKKEQCYITNLHDAFIEQKEQINSCPQTNDIFSISHLKNIDVNKFIQSEESWQLITDKYYTNCPNFSFIDFFWSVKNMHLPIWQLVEISKQAPRFKLLHTVSTGYAGYLASIISQSQQKPLILSEHGIYTRERKIDMLSCEWIYQSDGIFEKQSNDLNYLQKLWSKFFESLALVCYKQANKITSLFNDYKKLQIVSGAKTEKISIIPNGVKSSHFMQCYDENMTKPPKVICLIGRVVPIKDIKTFIKGIKLILNNIPDLQAWIVGNTVEDPDYAIECRNLVKLFGLQNKILFKGQCDLVDILPQVGLIALTSISEGLPLVLLEGFAAGIPAVCTDVGACKEIIYGQNDEFDNAGAIVPISNPNMFAQACAKFFNEPSLWLQARKAAINRVNKYYCFENMINSYHNIYKEYI